MKKILITVPVFVAVFFVVPSQVSAAITYATWDSTAKGADVSLSNSDLTATKTATNWQSVRSTIAKSTGKWYWEIKIDATGINNAKQGGVQDNTNSTNSYTPSTSSWARTTDGFKECGLTEISGLATFATNDVLGVAYDADNDTIDFYKNNTGIASCNSVTGALYAFIAMYDNADAVTANFGVSAFTYSPPSGYNRGLYDGTADIVSGTGTTNRIARFTATTTIGDSLLSDDGSNVTLTAGNLFLQIGSFIDSVTNGTLNFGTTNATTITFGRSGQNAVFNSNVGIGTSTPNWLLQLTGTHPSFALSDISAGTNLKHWLFSSMGGNLYIGTSTDAYATSTPAAMTILNNSSVIVPGALTWGKAFTVSNCSSAASPAICGGAPSGSVTLAAGGSTLVVNTTAVTANSQIFITEDSSLGTRLGITCNSTSGRRYSVNARTPGVSFTIKSNANPMTNAACLSYWILN